MANNNTYTVLGNDVITNGVYSIRFVMENDAPRFALCDFFKSLNYKSGFLPNYYRKKFNLGQVVGSDNILRHYVTKEQAEQIFPHLRLMTPEFRAFWEDVVIPATDGKYAELKDKIAEATETNKKLTEIYNTLNDENDALAAKIEHLIKEREAIKSILNKVA